LVADRSEENTVKRECICRRRGQAQVAAMNGVECAAEQGYTHSHHARAFLDEEMRRKTGKLVGRRWFAGAPPFQDDILKWWGESNLQSRLAQAVDEAGA
jgi:hypothetical protein